MILRSMLFVPGDSDKKLGKADSFKADALILDLEDAVAPGRKPIAREMVPDFLRARPKDARKVQLWVRINPLGTPDAVEDLRAIVAADPDGIIVPKVSGPADLQRLSYLLDAFEAAAGLPKGNIQFMPVATEVAPAPFALGDYAGANLSRLYGLTWGAEDLSSAIGASTNLGPDGVWTHTYQMVRSLTLLGAHAAGVEAVDTVYVNIADEEGLAASCRQARSEGFTGRIAIHPSQIPIINEGFMPSADDVAFAQRVVDAFAAEPGIGALQLDGKMLDMPHLVQAKKTLAAHAAFGEA
ncbi:MAG: CoA ester lyase [Alphaproteobacteria bacterium]|nr:MAG: CoA ester lyase [Alphaproteobacteria bacterium]